MQLEYINKLVRNTKNYETNYIINNSSFIFCPLKAKVAGSKPIGCAIKGVKMSNFQKVQEFMNTFGQEVKKKSEFPTKDITNLRFNLIKEELDELKEAIDQNNLLEVADALTDILYVTYGAGHAFGINLDDCFEEVQKSNMSKLDKNGKPIYNESGKVMKGPAYFKPNLRKFLT